MAASRVKRFQELQEERTRTFHDLEMAHKKFLGHAPNYENGFDDFKKSVSNCTDIFKRISNEIIEIKADLDKDELGKDFGDLVGKIQELEQKKLQTVVDVQLARQQALDNPGDELCEKNARLIQVGLNKLGEDITEKLTDIRYKLAEQD